MGKLAGLCAEGRCLLTGLVRLYVRLRLWRDRRRSKLRCRSAKGCCGLMGKLTGLCTGRRRLLNRLTGLRCRSAKGCRRLMGKLAGLCAEGRCLLTGLVRLYVRLRLWRDRRRSKLRCRFAKGCRLPDILTSLRTRWRRLLNRLTGLVRLLHVRLWRDQRRSKLRGPGLWRRLPRWLVRLNRRAKLRYRFAKGCRLPDILVGLRTGWRRLLNRLTGLRCRSTKGCRRLMGKLAGLCAEGRCLLTGLVGPANLCHRTPCLLAELISRLTQLPFGAILGIHFFICAKCRCT